MTTSRRTLDDTDRDPALAAQVDAALAASRVFVGVVASSLDADSLISLKQLRTLVLLVTHGPMNVATLATRLAIHPSNATRMCDRLEESGLLSREQAVEDRRRLMVTPTSRGRRLVGRIMKRRRVALEQVLIAMPSAERDQLARALARFAAAAGELGTDAPLA